MLIRIRYFVFLIFLLAHCYQSFSQTIGGKLNYNIIRGEKKDYKILEKTGFGISFCKTNLKKRIIDFDYSFGIELNQHSFKSNGYDFMCNNKPQSCVIDYTRTFHHYLMNGTINTSFYALYFFNSPKDEDYKKGGNFFVEAGLNVQLFLFSKAWIREYGKIVDKGNGYRHGWGEAPKINDVIGFGYFPNARTSYRLQFDNFIFYALQFSGDFNRYYYRYTDRFVYTRQISLKVTQKINIKRKQ